MLKCLKYKEKPKKDPKNEEESTEYLYPNIEDMLKSTKKLNEDFSFYMY